MTCRELAEGAQSDEERALLLELADHWDAIADLHEQLGLTSRQDSTRRRRYP